VEGQEEGWQVVNLGQVIQQRWSLATGLSLWVFFVFAMQCLSTLVVVRRETNSLRWPIFMFIYLSFLAYGASMLTYHLTNYLIR
jgi:ferrous iron transport protein B